MTSIEFEKLCNELRDLKRDLSVVLHDQHEMLCHWWAVHEELRQYCHICRGKLEPKEE